MRFFLLLVLLLLAGSSALLTTLLPLQAAAAGASSPSEGPPPPPPADGAPSCPPQPEQLRSSFQSYGASLLQLFIIMMGGVVRALLDALGCPAWAPEVAGVSTHHATLVPMLQAGCVVGGYFTHEVWLLCFAGL